jgi:hypothetical protein
MLLFYLISLYAWNLQLCTTWNPHVSTVYSIAVVLYLQFMLHVILFQVKYVLYFYICTLRSTCSAQYILSFCGSLISCSTGILLRHCLSVKWFQSPLLLLVSPLFFVFHMQWISVIRYLHYRIFSASFLIIFHQNVNLLQQVTYIDRNLSAHTWYIKRLTHWTSVLD